jgi:uncharacterized membrane protein YfcA
MGALGLATGVLSGLFGVGGGVISQPGMRLLGLGPLVAIGTALPVIIPGAGSGTLRYSRERLIRWRAVLATVPVGLVAAVGGAALSEGVPGDGHLLQLATACLLGFSAWRMRRARDTPAERGSAEPLAESDAIDAPVSPAVGIDSARDDSGTSTGTYVGIGVAAGGLSGLLGIGGGVLMVPAFVQLARMPVKTAIATSLACVGAFAVPGAITHGVQDHIDWRVAGALILGVVPGARLGAHLAIATADRRLRLVVSTFLGATAILYAGGELFALFD